MSRVMSELEAVLDELIGSSWIIREWFRTGYNLQAAGACVRMILPVVVGPWPALCKRQLHFTLVRFAVLVHLLTWIGSFIRWSTLYQFFSSTVRVD